MNMTVTIVREKQAESVPTLKDLEFQLANAEHDISDIEEGILSTMLNPEKNMCEIKKLREQFVAAHERRERVLRKIESKKEETELLAKYGKLLDDRKTASYLWAEAQLAGNRTIADNIHKDLMGTEYALAETERKLLELRDKKFAEK